jgi:hypothetical protein
MEIHLASSLIVIPSRTDGEEPRIACSRFLGRRGPSVRVGLALSVRLRMTAFGGQGI